MNIRRQDGIAVIIALMAMLLVTALGVALVLTSSTETLISSHFLNGIKAFYAADAALDLAISALPAQTGFVDGPPSGLRRLSDGSSVDLDQVLKLANSGNPVWRLYGYASLSHLLPASAGDLSFYVVVMLAGDPSGPDSVVSFRAEAFGARSAHKVLQATVVRGRGAVRVLSWREIRSPAP